MAHSEAQGERYLFLARYQKAAEMATTAKTMRPIRKESGPLGTPEASPITSSLPESTAS